MGLFDSVLINKAISDDNKSFSSITTEKAANIVKELSGGKIRHTTKIVDNVITITGAAGGTGASTIVANMAYIANTKHDLRVIVIDLNLLMPCQHLYFKIEQELNKPDLVGYLTGKNNLGEAIVNTKYADVLSANNRGLMDYIVCDSEAASANFQKAIDTLRSLYDLIIIDSPMKVENSLCNYAFYLSDKIYLIWDEGISCIANTEKIRRNMASSGIDSYTKTAVVLNKRTSLHYNDYPFKKLNIELLQVLPFESDIIYSSLNAEIFCKSGVSKSENSSYFCGGIEELTEKVIKAGGLVNGSEAAT